MLYGHGGNIISAAGKYGLEVDPSRIIDFSVSTSYLKYPDGLEEELRKAVSRISRYPEVDASGLRKELAGHHRLSPEHIMVGNGSTELLYLIPRALRIKSGLCLAPGYSDYEDALRYAGSKAGFFPLKREDDFALDMEGFVQKAKNYEIVFLGHPNNPTGRLLPVEEIKRLIVRFKETVFVIDEAYLSMVVQGRSFIEPPLPENLIVLRSLTKSFAVPGVRLGYAVACRSMTERLYQRKEPWTVNVFAAVAGSYLIGREEWLKGSAGEIASRKKALFDELSSINRLKIFKSAANFMLLKILSDNLTAGDLQAALLKRGCLIRDCSNFPGLDEGYFRIAVRRPEQNRLLVSALTELFLDND
ncbi:MAG: threonine-phosphate decarboxylase CobD [bacterium]